MQFINQKEDAGSDANIHFSPFRFTTFDAPGSKTFNANVGMYFGWQDIRGYDSIIPKQYVGVMNRIADQSGELLYNRIAPIYASSTSENGGNPFAALENQLLDLMGVKYVLSELVGPQYGLVGQGLRRRLAPRLRKPGGPSLAHSLQSRQSSSLLQTSPSWRRICAGLYS